MRLKGSIYSKVLRMDTGVSIITPNKVKPEGEKYKVVYLFHGLYGNSDTWVDYTRLPLYANKYDAVFVIPEAARSFYSDMKYGYNYFTYVTDELPKMIKSFFNISDKREDTFIMGASMGGHGALQCALTYPRKYAACAAFAPGPVYVKDVLDEIKHNGKDDYGIEEDYKSILGANFEFDEELELIEFARRINHLKEKPSIYIQCGKNDYLYEANKKFAGEMKELDYDFVFEESDAGHTWEFFDEALQNALKKYL